MPTIINAAVLATTAHHGQVDKAGRPYIEHVQAVAAAVSERGNHAIMAALLHDIVEDTDVTLDDLHAAGYPPEVVATVDAVTRRAGETYMAMIRRAAAHPLASLVKIADNAHNSDPEWLSKLDPATAARLGERYRKARDVLLAGWRLMNVVEYDRWWQDNTDHHGEPVNDLPEPVATLAAHVLALQGRIDDLYHPEDHGRAHGHDCLCMTTQCACAYDHPDAVCMVHAR